MAKAVLSEQAAASTQNIYQLDGKVPLLKAIPFGLQHILAMFVANLTPITLIGAASGLDHAQIAVLLQNAMFVALRPSSSCIPSGRLVPACRSLWVSALPL